MLGQGMVRPVRRTLVRAIPAPVGKIPNGHSRSMNPVFRERPAPRRSEVLWYPIHAYQHAPPSQSARPCSAPTRLTYDTGGRRTPCGQSVNVASDRMDKPWKTRIELRTSSSKCEQQSLLTIALDKPSPRLYKRLGNRTWIPDVYKQPFSIKSLLLQAPCGNSSLDL